MTVYKVAAALRTMGEELGAGVVRQWRYHGVIPMPSDPPALPRLRLFRWLPG